LVSGNVAGWLNVPLVHSVGVWQVWQDVGNPAAVWFGFVVAWYLAKWQLTHDVESPVYTPGVVWHWLHVRPACACVSGKLAGWLKFAPGHAVVLWHVLQSVESPAAA
jgi:hypothetical protein